MKYLRRQMRGKMGVPPQRIMVQNHVAWYWKWVALGVGLVLITGLVWWMFDAGQRLAGFDKDAAQRQLAELTEAKQQLTEENAKMRVAATELERQAQIDKSSQTEITKTLTQLQDENASLKEDLAFFRSIMSTSASPEGLSVYNFKLDADGTPNEYRYRMMIMQGGQRENDFRGRVQLILSVVNNGTPGVVTIPDGGKDKSAGLDVNFKYYQRVEGRLTLGDGAKIKSVQVRVLEVPSGQVMFSRNFNLS
ncbi:MAG: DUF6776 family protein [Burkholderiales bacterium]